MIIDLPSWMEREEGMKWIRVNKFENILINADGKIVATIIKEYGTDKWETFVGPYHGFMAARRAVEKELGLGYVSSEIG